MSKVAILGEWGIKCAIAPDFARMAPRWGTSIGARLGRPRRDAIVRTLSRLGGPSDRSMLSRG